MSRQTVNLRQHCQPTATNACVGSPPDRTFWGFPGKRCIGARCGVPLAFTSQSPGSGSASAAPIAAYATLENAMFIRPSLLTAPPSTNLKSHATFSADLATPAWPPLVGTRPAPARCNWPLESSLLRDVLVPLDGSTIAEHALPWAIEFAVKTGARLRLLHVRETAPRSS